jgi:hypothetical protein
MELKRHNAARSLVARLANALLALRGAAGVGCGRQAAFPAEEASHNVGLIHRLVLSRKFTLQGSAIHTDLQRNHFILFIQLLA